MIYPGSKVLLEVRDLRATVNGIEILKGIDLTVRSGEVHAIMGTNGSGKSTFCKSAGRSQRLSGYWRISCVSKAQICSTSNRKNVRAPAYSSLFNIQSKYLVLRTVIFCVLPIIPYKHNGARTSLIRLSLRISCATR